MYSNFHQNERDGTKITCVWCMDLLWLIFALFYSPYQISSGWTNVLENDTKTCTLFPKLMLQQIRCMIYHDDHFDRLLKKCDAKSYLGSYTYWIFLWCVMKSMNIIIKTEIHASHLTVIDGHATVLQDSLSCVVHSFYKEIEILVKVLLRSTFDYHRFRSYPPWHMKRRATQCWSVTPGPNNSVSFWVVLLAKCSATQLSVSS